MSENALKMTAGIFDMAAPVSSAPLALSRYASLPASASVNNLTIPVPKFDIIFGISKKPQMIIRIDRN